MENKNIGKLNISALVISVFPLATFIPVLLKIVLPDEVRTIWAGANILLSGSDLFH